MPDVRLSSTLATVPRGAAVAGSLNGRRAAKPLQIYLNEHVLMGMLLSCVEVYKKECFGLLLGYRAPGKYIVEHAIAYQSVRRGHNWAELRSDKWKVLQEVLRNFPKLDILGDFHSHTMYRDVKARVSLSQDDIEYMEPDDLQIVIAVNENKRSRGWSLNADRTISGSIDRFYFKLAAYYFAHPSRRRKVSRNGARRVLGQPRLADIVCPFTMGYKN